MRAADSGCASQACTSVSVVTGGNAVGDPATGCRARSFLCRRKGYVTHSEIQSARSAAFRSGATGSDSADTSTSTRASAASGEGVHDSGGRKPRERRYPGSSRRGPWYTTHPSRRRITSSKSATSSGDGCNPAQTQSQVIHAQRYTLYVRTCRRAATTPMRLSMTWSRSELNICCVTDASRPKT